MLGDEFEDVADILFNENEEFVAAGGQGSLPAQGGQQATNQTGLPSPAGQPASTGGQS